MFPLHYLILEVTQACNHACAHCYNYWPNPFPVVKNEEGLTREEIYKYISKIYQETEVRDIGISGGEPMLRSDLSEIANDLVEMGLNIIIISNGSLISDSRIKDFPSEVTFELTLFSSEENIHDEIARHNGAFKKVIKAAVAVRKRKCGLAIACVLTNHNLKGLQRTIELALALGADGILLNRVNLTKKSFHLTRDLVLPADELRRAFELVNNIAEKFGIQIAVSVPIPPCLVDPTPYKSLQFGWCPRGGADGYYTIGYNGLVRPCNHSSIVLGNLREQSFKQIVTSSEAINFWSVIPTVCIACNHPLRNSCKGGCPAASFECYESFEQRDPYIEFAGASW
jgi:radical SAM protein with 4Fe4S-binding SPASM domain